MTKPRIPANLTCPVCGGQQFDTVLSRTDSQLMTGRHKTTLMVCTGCAYTYTFFGRA